MCSQTVASTIWRTDAIPHQNLVIQEGFRFRNTYFETVHRIMGSFLDSKNSFQKFVPSKSWDLRGRLLLRVHESVLHGVFDFKKGVVGFRFIAAEDKIKIFATFDQCLCY